MNEPGQGFRFSLQSVLAVTVFAALGQPNLFWACVWTTVANFSIVIAILCALTLEGRSRIFFIGYAAITVVPEVSWTNYAFDQIYLPNAILRYVGTLRGYSADELLPAYWDQAGELTTGSYFMRSGHEISRILHGLLAGWLAVVLYSHRDWLSSRIAVAETPPRDTAASGTDLDDWHE